MNQILTKSLGKFPYSSNNPHHTPFQSKLVVPLFSIKNQNGNKINNKDIR